MKRLIISTFLIFFCLTVDAQKYIGKDGVISFFSEAPLENISAINHKVAAVYDAKTKEIVFHLYIEDFEFPIALMQEHFNENYLESDIFPKSTFVGKIIELKENIAYVEGDLNIHGQTNKIFANGKFVLEDKIVNISDVNFLLKLKDYKIKIPKIVLYKIAEVIEVKVDIKMKLQ